MSEHSSGTDQRAFYGRPQHDAADCRDPERLLVESAEETPPDCAVCVGVPHYRPASEPAVRPSDTTTLQTA
jgi:hypothetical protein